MRLARFYFPTKDPEHESERRVLLTTGLPGDSAKFSPFKRPQRKFKRTPCSAHKQSKQGWVLVASTPGSFSHKGEWEVTLRAQALLDPGSSHFSKVGIVGSTGLPGPSLPRVRSLPQPSLVPAARRTSGLFQGQVQAALSGWQVPPELVSLGAAGKPREPHPRHCWGWAGPWKETNCLLS